MSLRFRAGAGKGRITRGIAAGTLPRQTIDFVLTQLPAWRDDRDREPKEAEEDLNGQLCKFLNTRARSVYPMAHFHHEEPQTRRHRVDVSALATKPIWAGSRRYSIYEPFLVLEGKRLPAPPPRDREREYVTGADSRSRAPTGGIQRFKLGLHGAAVETAAMIAYVQQGTPEHWHKTINQWIADLAKNPGDDACDWTKGDMLHQLREDVLRAVTGCRSSHARSSDTRSGTIELHHLWVVMNA